MSETEAGDIRTAIEALPVASGSYALVLELAVEMQLAVGRLGRLEFAAGYYVYVGSAFGPGGLRARLSRHWNGTGRRHWHVDYLRSVAQPMVAWYQVQRAAREHEWAAAFARSRSLEPVPGFGCTDCQCRSHLYATSELPSITAFRRRLGPRASGEGRLQRLQP